MHMDADENRSSIKKPLRMAQGSVGWHSRLRKVVFDLSGVLQVLLPAEAFVLGNSRLQVHRQLANPGTTATHHWQSRYP